MADDASVPCIADGELFDGHDWSQWVDRPTDLPHPRPGSPMRLRWCRNCNLHQAVSQPVNPTP